MAGSLIGQLKVVLGLETAGFETGTRRAAKQVDEFGSKAEKLGNQIGTMGKALGAAAVAFAGSQIFSALKDLTTQGLAYASSLGEQAQQLGVSAKALQQYRYAASQVGIETADMDNALAQLTKRIGQAANGAKGPAQAFRELGISIRDAQGKLLTADAAIPKIADALARIPDPAQRAAMEVELFGKSGQKLDNLLSGGSAAVNNLRNAADELGIVIDDKLIANADDAADKMSALKDVLSAQIASVVAANAKEIEQLTSELAKFAIEALKALNAWLAFRRAQNDTSAQVAKANAYLDARKDLNPDQRSRAKNMARTIIEDRNGIKSETTSYLGGLFKLRSSSMKNQFGAAGNNPFAGFAPGTVNYLAQLQAADAAAGVTAGAQRVADAVQSLSEKTRTYADAMNVSFAQAADGILGAMDRLSGAFRGGGFLDKLGAVLNFGLSLGSAGVFGKKIQTSINIPKRANGGPVMAGRMHLVGERGPELLVPSSNGTIIPNHALGGMGGGTTRVEVVPSKYFDVRVHENIAAAAPGIIRAGAEGGERRVGFRNSRRVQ